ncbi:MAG TPA: DMT family transporter [Polyangiales bacterium]|nr:DMT family transporter [Polyangiales bacterium]
MLASDLDIAIYVAVLGSAFTNALWNSMVHSESEKRHSIVTVMLLVEGALALCALPFVTLPGRAAWGWLAGGTALRVAYTFVLLRAYARIELSRIYPIARGTAPLVLAILGLALFGDRLGLRGTLAVLAITTGVLTIARVDRRPLPHGHALRYGAVLSLFIAGYSLVDARGVRASEDALGYAALAFLGEAIGFLGATFAARRRFGLTLDATVAKTGTVAGILGTLSYLVALWAFTRAPAALVAALRETSVLFALFLARTALREQVALRDWVGGVLIVAGAVSLRT